MPQLLKHDTVRLFEASQESLFFAVLGIHLPRRFNLREKTAETALPCGLIGVAAEMVMSACVAQVHGIKALMKDDNKFLTASEILYEFRKILREQVPKSNFLSQGVSDKKSHFQLLQDQTKPLSLIVKARALGLHSGEGYSNDICIKMANDVHTLMQTLSLSNKIRPYFDKLPEIPKPSKEYRLIAEELMNLLHDTSDTQNRAKLISSLYLVLPDIPTEAPDWLEAFDRVTVAPKDEDVSFLVSVLQHARCAEFLRVSPSQIPCDAEPIHVVVAPGDQSALPISPQALRREFTQIADQWNADIANANGRLNENIVGLPPLEAVLKCFMFPENVNRVLQGKEMFTAHESWPAIAASLSYQGTPGPVWFLVRKTNDIGQLRAQLSRAAVIGSSFLRKRLPHFLEGIQALFDQTEIPQTHLLYGTLLRYHKESYDRRDKLADIIESKRGTEKELPVSWNSKISSFFSDENSLNEILSEIAQTSSVTSDDTRSYWAKAFSAAATEAEDVPGLISILSNTELKSSHTVVRKAIQSIDFAIYGPTVMED